MPFINTKQITMEHYSIRRAIHSNDDKRLNTLLTSVFYPEEVGVFAEILFNHFPGMENRYWFIAEEKTTSQMVSAFALIPWIWEMGGIQLKVAEMGLVGTAEEHRIKGLMKRLNQEFDQTLTEDGFDLAVIQGIPGFYHKFGYHYALELENHINLPLNQIQHTEENNFTYRLAERTDIPFLMQEDAGYRKEFFLSSQRTEAHWEYLLSHGMKTECASEFRIAEHRRKPEKFYFRILLKGFGSGLNVTEVSQNCSELAFIRMLGQFKKLALERKKPYVRFNLNMGSDAARTLIANGAHGCRSYAWQIRIPDKIRFLNKIRSLLETRINSSQFADFTGILRLNLFSEYIDLKWARGKIDSIAPGGEVECSHSFCISHDMFAALVLGYRSWEEIQYIRPDVAPETLYVMPSEDASVNQTGQLINVLFPKCLSWINLPY
jgi:hypothetical protein